jgi:uncharacterized protein (TIGR02231 family)
MRVVSLLSLAFSLGAQASSVALAKDVDAASRIVSVVVHPDAATITRETSVDLPAGAATVVFRNLPYALDAASLRVSGESNARLLIGAVETRAAPPQPAGADAPLDVRLKALRDERAAIQATLDALAAKQAMIVHYSQASPEKLSPEARPLAIGDWSAAFDAIGAAHAKVGGELRLAQAKAQALDLEIRGLETGARGVSRAPAREVAVAVESTGGKAKLALEYLTGGAGWTPAYEARLDTGDAGKKPELELVRRAMVSQRTGEDWSDVSLAVSTVRAQRGAAAPEVTTQALNFWEPMAAQYRGGAAAPMAKAMRQRNDPASVDALGRMAEDAAPAAPAPEPAQQQAAALDAGAFQAMFRVGGAVSAPGDGTAKNFVLSSRKMEPKLAIRAAPALDPTAYLEAHLVNDEDAPLLPGPLSVQRDGVYVGASRIGLVAPGDAADFGFGVDDKVKVTRMPVKRTENEPTWYGQTKSETRDFKTSVKNMHSFPVHVSVIDRVPVAENTSITVETLPQTTAPSEKQIADRRGVMGWTFDLPPGETKDIRLAWRVKWPADREITPR